MKIAFCSIPDQVSSPLNCDLQKQNTYKNEPIKKIYGGSFGSGLALYLKQNKEF